MLCIHRGCDLSSNLQGHTHQAILDHADHIFERSPDGMIHWNVHFLSESAAENRALIQIKNVHSSVSYHQAILPIFLSNPLLSGLCEVTTESESWGMDRY